MRTYLDLKVSGVEVIQPFQEDLVQNCNLFGEKKNERKKKMVEGCTKYLPAAGRRSTRYQVDSEARAEKQETCLAAGR